MKPKRRWHMALRSAMAPGLKWLIPNPDCDHEAFPDMEGMPLLTTANDDVECVIEAIFRLTM